MSILLVVMALQMWLPNAKANDGSLQMEWGPWGGWGGCSRQCGNGIMYRVRECKYPKGMVQHGRHRRQRGLGKSHRRKMKSNCVGMYKEYRTCEKQACPGDLSSRASQCQEFNNKLYMGRRIKAWEPYERGKPPGPRGQCKLVCRATGYSFFAKLAEKVEDGTKCLGGVCINGYCQQVGCDGVIGSNKHLDKCGKCGGDGTSCRIVSGIFTNPKLKYGYNTVIKIPKGACQINVTEMRPSRNYLVLKRESGKFILNGNWAIDWTGTYVAAGGEFHYTRSARSKGEQILATGPINETIELQILYQNNNPGIMYSFAIKKEKVHDMMNMMKETMNEQDPQARLPQTSNNYHSNNRHRHNGHHRKTQSDTPVYSNNKQPTRGRVYPPTRNQNSQINTNRQSVSNTGYNPRLPNGGVGGVAATRNSQYINARSRYVPGSVQTGTQTYPGSSLYRNSAQPGGTNSQFTGRSNPRYGYQGTASNPRTDPRYSSAASTNNRYPNSGASVPQYNSRGGVNPQFNSRGGVNPQYNSRGGVNPQYNSRGGIIPQYTNTRGASDPRYRSQGNSNPSNPRNPQYPHVLSAYRNTGIQNDKTPISAQNSALAKYPPSRNSQTPGGSITQGSYVPPGVAGSIPKYSQSGGSFAPNRQQPGGSFAPNRQQPGGSFAPNRQQPGGSFSPNIQQPGLGNQQQGGLIDPSLGGQAQAIPTQGSSENYDWKISGFSACSRTCGGGIQETLVVCVKEDNSAVVLDDNCDKEKKPEKQRVACNPKACEPDWDKGEWSGCTTTCGKGIQTRRVECKQRMNPQVHISVSASLCSGASKPATTKMCELAECARWKTGKWNSCPVECGKGSQTREVVCVDHQNSTIPDSECELEKPVSQTDCDMGPCSKAWYYTEWSNQCSSDCGDGFYKRKLYCSSNKEEDCSASSRPESERSCENEKQCGAKWFTGPWSKCSSECAGTQTREVLCMRHLSHMFVSVSERSCGQEKPITEKPCEQSSCNADWYMTDWTECTQSCGGGQKMREVRCLDRDQKPSNACTVTKRPESKLECNSDPCPTQTPDPSCKDKYTNCRLVKQARLCRYSYYKTVCCDSCKQHKHH
ncbi:unnamed protein product [Owenia fusiformis]|uniref:PLAC domain-containing protein n=1 Tax=Owenia fusiformis TaxID=6347 RepID=A0A8S4PWG0_OWEFU|nr:unnamed protein product [Owenia fusiformis]